MKDEATKAQTFAAHLDPDRAQQAISDIERLTGRSQSSSSQARFRRMTGDFRTGGTEPEETSPDEPEGSSA